METIFWILVSAAAIGAFITYFGGNKSKEDAAEGAVAGAMFAGSCLFQLLIYGIVIVAALWLFRKVFL
jgi:hypothetical protein